MSFFNQKNKFQYLFNQSQKNQNLLTKKTVSPKVILPNDSFFKVPEILYDSGWIEPGILSGSIISGEQNVYFHYNKSTVKKGQSTPFSLFYTLQQNLNIPETYLPFIQASIFVDKAPEVMIEGVFPFQRYEYGSDYWKIYGDAVKIYQGFSPATTLQSEIRRIAGDFSASLASKWYYGTTKYSISGDNYEMQNGYVVEGTTYYDVIALAPFQQCDGSFLHNAHEYKKFEFIAIDGISSSSIQGTGTLTEVKQVVCPSFPTRYFLQTTVTKNVTLTVPLFEDTTILELSGSLYKNDVFQAFYLNTNPYTVSFAGTFGGDASLTNFSYNWLTNQYWKLFYSNKRAKQFLFNTSTRIPLNLPETTDYEIGTLPYTHLYVDENPSGYPTIQEDDSLDLNIGSTKNIWTKISNNIYTFRINGKIILLAPARQESTTPVQFVDERYSEVGITYTRDAEDRDAKNMPLYFPEPANTKLRLILSLVNPKQYDAITTYKK